MKPKNTKEHIRKRALDILARREQSCRGLKEKLLKYGSADVISDVVVELKRGGIVSDERFAVTAVRYYSEKCYGPCYIYAKLNSHGVDEKIIEKVLLPYKGKWEILVKKQRIKRFGNEKCFEPQEIWRQKRYLQRRGFLPDDIDNAF